MAKPDLDKIIAGLDELSNPGFMVIASKAISEDACSRIQRCFASGVSPDGVAWEPLKWRSGQPLRDTRILQNGLRRPQRTDAGGFEIGSTAPYAKVHLYGKTIEVKTKKVLFSKKLGVFFGKKVEIPARPFLPLAGIPDVWRTGWRALVSKLIASKLGF